MDMQLASNMDKLEKLFGSRMCDWAVGASPSHPDLSKLNCEFSEFKTFVCEALSTIKNQIELLSLGLDRHESALRKKVLLLHGISEKQNEKIHNVVHKVFTDQLGLSDMLLEHLQVCHRLGGALGKTRPILVRFINMEQRHLVWDNKSALKGTGITVSEFLTKARHKILLTARGHFGIKQCWSTEGKITIILPDKSRRKIETLVDLNSLIAKFPSTAAVATDTQGTASSVLHTSKTTAKAKPNKSRRQ